MKQVIPDSDREFITVLRATVERYLAAVDQWEAGYQKYYRLPGYAAKISEDLIEEEREYLKRKRELQELLPRARRLCLKYRMQDPFKGLVLITLGRFAPQHRVDSAIGRNERSVVAKCLMELTDAAREWEGKNAAPVEAVRERTSLLQRVVDYFF